MLPGLMRSREMTMKKELQDASEEELRRLDKLSPDQIDTMEGFEDKEQEYIDSGGARYRKVWFGLIWQLDYCPEAWNAARRNDDSSVDLWSRW